MKEGFLRLILISIISVVSIGASIMILGLLPQERNILFLTIKKKFGR